VASAPSLGEAPSFLEGRPLEAGVLLAFPSEAVILACEVAFQRVAAFLEEEP
jgi:hypothetical protein